MIKEDYVSFETAKLLKEKGFDWTTEHKIWYVIEQFSTGCPWNSCTHKVGDKTREYDEKYCISMPTIQMAMKWLKEKGFYIFSPIEVDYDEDERGVKWHHQPTYYPEIRRVSDGKIMCDDGTPYCTPEQANEAGIIYCLKNLM